MAVLEKVSYFVGEGYRLQQEEDLIPVAFAHLGFTLSTNRYRGTRKGRN